MADLKVFTDGHEPKTICYLIRKNKSGQNEILLAKHRKQGKRNGVGGKVGDKEAWKDETIEEGAIREVREELGVEVKDMVERGIVNFIFEMNGKLEKVCGHIFFITKWEGEPQGIEVDDPQWFSIDSIPWEELWENDKEWLHPLLDNEFGFLEAEYDFGRTSDEKVAAVNYFKWRV